MFRRMGMTNSLGREEMLAKIDLTFSLPAFSFSFPAFEMGIYFRVFLMNLVNFLIVFVGFQGED